jgi:hypothetical protein
MLSVCACVPQAPFLLSLFYGFFQFVAFMITIYDTLQLPAFSCATFAMKGPAITTIEDEIQYVGQPTFTTRGF